jgi:hypothetical protein
MADKSSDANSQIQSVVSSSVGTGDTDSASIFNPVSASPMMSQLLVFNKQADSIKDTTSGANTFTVGNKDQPIAPTNASTKDDATKQTTTQECTDQQAADADTAAQTTDASNKSTESEMENADKTNLFIYKSGLSAESTNTATSISTLSGSSSLSSAVSSDWSSATLMCKESPTLGVQLGTSTWDKFCTKVSMTVGPVKDRLVASIKSGKALTLTTLTSAITGSSGSASFEDSLRSGVYDSTINKYGSALGITGSSITGAIDKAESIKKSVTSALNQANAIKKQVDSLVKSIKTTCGFSSGQAAKFSSLLGDGTTHNILSSSIDNKLIDMYDLFGDKSVTKLLSDAIGKVSSPFTTSDLEKMACRLATGSASGSDLKSYVTTALANNDLVKKLGLANDLIKAATKTDDTSLLDKLIADTSNAAVSTAIAKMSQANIEIITTQAANRGAPRALDRIADLVGKYKVKNIKSKIIKAHMNDTKFDNALFLTHVEKYKINLSDYANGAYTGSTISTLSSNSNLSSLNAVDLFILKELSVASMSSTQTALMSNLNNAGLLDAIPVV